MLITIIGKSAGVSKKGNPFCIAHYTAKKPNVQGLYCNNMFVSPNLMSADAIEVGADYNADYDESGYLTGLYRV